MMILDDWYPILIIDDRKSVRMILDQSVFFRRAHGQTDLVVFPESVMSIIKNINTFDGHSQREFAFS